MINSIGFIFCFGSCADSAWFETCFHASTVMEFTTNYVTGSPSLSPWKEWIIGFPMVFSSVAFHLVNWQFLVKSLKDVSYQIEVLQAYIFFAFEKILGKSLQSRTVSARKGADFMRHNNNIFHTFLLWKKLQKERGQNHRTIWINGEGFKIVILLKQEPVQSWEQKGNGEWEEEARWQATV